MPRLADIGLIVAGDVSSQGEASVIVAKPVIAIAAIALLIAARAPPATAQYDPCGDLYNRTMAIYQTYGPHSPQYAEMLQHYSAQCLGGSPGPYYAQPAPIDPGAAIIGGVIGGAVLGGVLAGRHRDHDRRDRRFDGRRDRRFDGRHDGRRDHRERWDR
jgi:hypothetical protein